MVKLMNRHCIKWLESRILYHSICVFKKKIKIDKHQNKLNRELIMKLDSLINIIKKMLNKKVDGIVVPNYL